MISVSQEIFTLQEVIPNRQLEKTVFSCTLSVYLNIMCDSPLLRSGSPPYFNGKKSK